LKTKNKKPKGVPFLVKLAEDTGLSYSCLCSRYYDLGWRGDKLIGPLQKNVVYCGETRVGWAKLINKKVGTNITSGANLVYFFRKKSNAGKTNKEILLEIFKYYNV